MTRWTITDTCLSPDQRLLVYASISPVAFVVTVGNPGDLVSEEVALCTLQMRWSKLARFWRNGLGGQLS